MGFGVNGDGGTIRRHLERLRSNASVVLRRVSQSAISDILAPLDNMRSSAATDNDRSALAAIPYCIAELHRVGSGICSGKPPDNLCWTHGVPILSTAVAKVDGIFTSWYILSLTRENGSPKDG